METPFPGADKCNYIDLANFIRGEEIKLVRYLFYAEARLPSNDSREKIASRRGEELESETNGKRSAEPSKGS